MANKIKEGSKEKISLGDISLKKEWNFAGDFARAILTLTGQGNIFETVIGCGITHSIEDWLKVCFNHIDKNWKDFVILKPGFVPEYDILVSDPSLLYSLGYKPKINFEQLAQLMLNNQNK
jgi:GDPmannose 4,6-dehydratase